MDFFSLSKLFWLFAQPLTLMWLSLVLATFLVWRAKRRFAAVFLALVTLASGLVLYSNLGALWLQSLENVHARPAVAIGEDIAGIIVLGGGFDGRVTRGRGGYALGEAGDRFVEAAMLAAANPELPVIVSGGEASFIGTAEGDAVIAPRFYGRLGIGAERLVLEGRSRNTWENAVFSAEIIDADYPDSGPWLLVTSAFHMPRSVGCFRQAGVEVVPWPVDYRIDGRETFRLGRDDPLRAVAEFSLALRESIGLIVYRRTGRLAAG